jgi:3-hydroxyanthranilate 3,4-dioxygenase
VNEVSREVIDKPEQGRRTTMSIVPPIHFQTWVEENSAFLKPPTGAKPIWRDTDFIVLVVGGPNQRTDYHVNPTEEFFYQIKGDMNLKIVEDGQFRDLPIREGEVFLLPAKTPHSPQRKAETVGIVIERRRPAGSNDRAQWYCEQCHALVYEAEGQVTKGLVEFLNAALAEYRADQAKRTCPTCGHVNSAV